MEQPMRRSVFWLLIGIGVIGVLSLASTVIKGTALTIANYYVNGDAPQQTIVLAEEFDDSPMSSYAINTPTEFSVATANVYSSNTNSYSFDAETSDTWQSNIILASSDTTRENTLAPHFEIF